MDVGVSITCVNNLTILFHPSFLNQLMILLLSRKVLSAEIFTWAYCFILWVFSLNI